MPLSTTAVLPGVCLLILPPPGGWMPFLQAHPAQVSQPFCAHRVFWAPAFSKTRVCSCVCCVGKPRSSHSSPQLASQVLQREQPLPSTSWHSPAQRQPPFLQRCTTACLSSVFTGICRPFSARLLPGRSFPSFYSSAVRDFVPALNFVRFTGWRKINAGMQMAKYRECNLCHPHPPEGPETLNKTFAMFNATCENRKLVTAVPAALILSKSTRTLLLQARAAQVHVHF